MRFGGDKKGVPLVQANFYRIPNKSKLFWIWEFSCSYVWDLRILTVRVGVLGCGCMLTVYLPAAANKYRPALYKALVGEEKGLDAPIKHGLIWCPNPECKRIRAPLSIYKDRLFDSCYCGKYTLGDYTPYG